MNNKDRWSQLSLKEKAQLLGIYASKGYTDLASIVAHYNAAGGELDKPPIELPKSYRRSAKKMNAIRGTVNKHLGYAYPYIEPTDAYSLRNNNGGLAQATYLLDRDTQNELFRQAGYIPVTDGNYGLVTKAVDGRKLPMWQTAPNDIDRNKLSHIGNIMDTDNDEVYFNNPLVHAGRYPVALYVDPATGEPYGRAWDLNDYAGTSSNNDNPIITFVQNLGTKMLDKVGSPVVVTTGYQKLPDIPEQLAEMVYKRNGLVPTESIDLDEDLGRDAPLWSLPEVVITADRVKAKGGHLFDGDSEPTGYLANPDKNILPIDKDSGLPYVTLQPVEVVAERKIPYTLPTTVVANKTRVALKQYPIMSDNAYQSKVQYEYRGYPFNDKEDFINASYNNWYETALSKGDTVNADNFARFATAQDAYESAYGTSTAAKSNNFGGMRINNKNIAYKTPEEYYKAKYDMLKNKMPHVLRATTYDGYIDSLNAGEYKYAPHEDGNQTYEQDLRNMKTALKYLEKIPKKANDKK